MKIKGYLDNQHLLCKIILPLVQTPHDNSITWKC